MWATLATHIQERCASFPLPVQDLPLQPVRFTFPAEAERSQSHTCHPPPQSVVARHLSQRLLALGRSTIRTFYIMSLPWLAPNTLCWGGEEERGTSRKSGCTQGWSGQRREGGG